MTLDKLNQVFASYFEKRFPFFKFTLPVLLMIYPLILVLVPLYMMPKYYPLHLLYLFLIVSNLRLLRDIVEKRIEPHLESDFKKMYAWSTVAIIIFSAIFNNLERGMAITSFHLNWRSFFFFFSSVSILIFSWSWYFGFRDLFKSELVKKLIPHFKYPLFLVPPLMLHIHESQLLLLTLFMLVLLFHAFSFELCKSTKKNSQMALKIFLGLYTLVLTSASYLGNGSLIFSGLLFFIGIVYFLKAKVLNQNFIFGPTILFGWGNLILNL